MGHSAHLVNTMNDRILHQARADFTLLIAAALVGDRFQSSEVPNLETSKPRLGIMESWPFGGTDAW
jgi:hypothetical protein